MKSKILLLILLIFSVNVIKAQNINRAFRLLEKNKYEKAERIFNKIIKKKTSSDANYGLSKIYSEKDFEKFNLYTSHKWITKAENNFNSDKKNKISINQISEFKNEIENNIINNLEKEKSIKSCDEFLEYFKDDNKRNIAKEIKANILFEDLNNDEESYNSFIQKFKNTKAAKKATEKRDELVFNKIEKTYEAYKNFIEKYPNSKQIENAKIELDKIVPFFAITGFASDLENISLNDLKLKSQKEVIYILKSLENKVTDFLGESCKFKTIEKLSDFNILAKNNILITNIKNLSNQFKTLKIDNIDYFENPEKYPLSKAGKSFYKDKITKFTLTGVTAITRAIGRAADEYGTDFLTKNLKHHFQTSDYVHISNEVSFAKGCDYNKGRKLKFCTKERDFQAILDLNANIVELTGNHNLDYGKKAYAETFKWYETKNIKTFGGGISTKQAAEPLIIELKEGYKLGFIGFNEYCPCHECTNQTQGFGANPYDKETSYEAVKKLKEKVDFVIATVQFHEVDSYEPAGSHISISKKLANSGADLVYGSQAHQIKKVEFYNGKSLFYGIGNFLFDQIHRLGLRQGFFLQNYFYKGKLIQSKPIYTFISDKRRPELATKKQIKAIKKEIFTDKLIYKH